MPHLNLIGGLLDFIRGIKNKVAIKLTGSQKAMLDEAERTLVNLMRSEGQSGGGEVRYSVKKDVNGNPYVEIDEDILAGVPKNRWIQTVKKALSSGTIDVNGFDVAIRAVTRNEYFNSKAAQNLKINSNNIYTDKLRMANNIDEIVQNAYNTRNENAEHNNFSSFNRGQIAVRVGNNGYMVDVVTGINPSNNEILYDLVNISKAKIKEDFP